MDHFERPDQDLETLHIRTESRFVDAAGTTTTNAALDALRDWAGNERARLDSAASLGTWERIASKLPRD